MPSRSLGPASRNLENTPEAIAAERFRELHPGERVLYTRLLRHGDNPVVVIAHGDERPPLRTHFLVDLGGLTARQLSESEVNDLLSLDGDDR